MRCIWKGVLKIMENNDVIEFLNNLTDEQIDLEEKIDNLYGCEMNNDLMYDILIENNDIKKEINNIIRKNASSFAGFIEKETQSLLSQKLISEMDYTSGLYNCDELYVNAIKTVFDLQYKSKKNFRR